VPLWFSIEYYFIYKFLGLDNEDQNDGNNSSDQKNAPQQQDRFDHFKYGQEIATKAWLAVVTVLTGLYFGAMIPFFHKNPEPTNQVVVECKQCPCSIVKP